MVSKLKKRDGRIVVFDQNKIASAIGRAGHKVGHGDDLLSEELASVVTLFINKSFGRTIPTSEDVQDVVERVLMETGHSDAARTFILHGERRTRQLEALRILDLDQTEAGTALLEVDHAVRLGVSPWSKGRIIADLVDESGIPPEMASEIASEVEKRILGSGLLRVSATLVQELVDNELFNRGYTGRTLSAIRVGMRATEVRALAESDAGGRTPAHVSAEVTDSVLKQFSIKEIYSPEEVDLHLRDVATLEGLTLPSGYLEINLDPCRLPAPFGKPETPASYLGAVVPFLERFTTGPVRIDLTKAGLEQVAQVGGDPSQWAYDMVAALSNGPAGAPSLRCPPELRLCRRLSPSAERIVERSGLNPQAAQDILDSLIAGFLDALRALGRTLCVPHLNVDLLGDRLIASPLLDKAVVMETSGRVTLSVRGCDSDAMAAIEPLVTGGQLDLTSVQNAAGHRSGPRFVDELGSTLRLLIGSFTSKSRFLARLHRGGRGPKASLRRFMGSDSAVVGPGSFRILINSMGRAAKRAATGGSRTEDPAVFVTNTLQTVQTLLREEERRLGLKIRFGPIWTRPDRELFDLFERSPDSAARFTAACGRFTGLDPLPDFFVGDARARIEFLQALLKRRSEQDHAA